MRATVPFLAVVLLASACASVESGPTRDVAGTWMGECRNCPVTAFTLVIAQAGGRLAGTLHAAGSTGLGERPIPLRNGTVVGGRVTFRAVGADGKPFQADLTVSEDGGSMAGYAQLDAVFPLAFKWMGR